MNRAAVKNLSLGVLLGAVVFGGLAFSHDDNESPVEVLDGGRLQYKWFTTATPKSMSFAGEKVPLDNWEVKERLDRELLANYYMHGSTLYILKLKDRVFPIIEERLKANGIPEDFKYLCVAESALRNQTSPAGAVGYWQFLKATGTQFGLEINGEVDERYHLERATDAACAYLRAAYEKFGSWTAAAASYNCGMGGYNGHSTFQMTSNYYDLLLPEETNRYMFRILALKELIGNPKKYGYIVADDDAYQALATRKVIVDKSIPNLAAYAREQGTTYKMMKTLNPWLRDRSLTVSAGKQYALLLPQK